MIATQFNILFACTLMCCTIADYSFVEDYAPRIWMDKHELFFPCSVDFFQNYTRPAMIKNNIWYVSKENLTSPVDILPYFTGQNPGKESVPVYAIIMPSETEPNPVEALKYPLTHNITVTYFTLYSYNRGKEFLFTVWDNHVGDIEHIHIYFVNGKPDKVVASWHAWNTTKNWNDSSVEKIGNHPIVYSARGSHGLWFSAGNHTYHTNPTLTDITSNGTAWDTWNNVSYIFPWDWNSTFWLTEVLRWGDPSTDFPVDNCFFGYCRLGDGPVGMLGKSQIQRSIKNLVEKGLVCEKGCVWNAGIYT